MRIKTMRDLYAELRARRVEVLNVQLVDGQWVPRPEVSDKPRAALGYGMWWHGRVIDGQWQTIPSTPGVFTLPGTLHSVHD